MGNNQAYERPNYKGELLTHAIFTCPCCNQETPVTVGGSCKAEYGHGSCHNCPQCGDRWRWIIGETEKDTKIAKCECEEKKS